MRKPNAHRVEGSFAILTLTRGKEVTIDAYDLQFHGEFARLNFND